MYVYIHISLQEERKLSSFLREKNDELQSQLDDVHKQLEQLQVKNQLIVSKNTDNGNGMYLRTYVLCGHVCMYVCTVVS